MNESISAQQWMEHISSEYLSAYIPQGGSTIKFIVADDQKNKIIKDLIKKESSNLGYLVAELESKESRVHMQQDIFFSFAKQIDWRMYAREYLISKIEQAHYLIDSVSSADPNAIASIAKLNNVEIGTLIREIRPQIESEVYKDAESMSIAFRTAMTHLCMIELSSNDTYYQGQAIIDWLDGTNTRIGGVKSFQIFTPINRTTAKNFFESALYWLDKVGVPGVFLTLDNRRVTEPTNPRDGTKYYTRPMVMQHYEVLRKWIDSTEKLTSVFILVLANTEFLNPVITSRSRSVHMYNALHTRILDDVRGRNQVNPNASLLTID